MLFALSNGVGNEGAGNVGAVDGLQRSDSEDGKDVLSGARWQNTTGDFRQEATGKKDVRWGEEKVHLTLIWTPPSKGASKYMAEEGRL